MPLPVAPYLYTTTAQLEYPVGTGVTVTTKAGAYSNSNWVTLHPSTPQAWRITAIVADANNGGLGITEIDLGVGVDGSEVVIATSGHFQGNAAVHPLALPGAWVEAGVRLAVRVRSETPFAGFLYSVNVLYLPAPVDGRVAAPTTPLRLSPSAAGLSITSSTTAWANGNWGVISGATATLWAIAGVQILPLAVVGSVPVSMEIDLGAGETVLTTIRWASVVQNIKPTTIALIWPLFVVAPGTTLTARLRTSGSDAVTVRVKVQYYTDLTGLDGLTTERPTTWFPSAADGFALAPAGGWADSQWQIVGSDAGAARVLTQVAVDLAPVTGEHEVEVGAGGVGAEVPIGAFRFATDQVSDVGSDHTTLPLLVPYAVDANTLLSVRARSAGSGSDLTVRTIVGWIDAPDFALALTGIQYIYVPAADGPSLTVTNAGWVNSPWGMLVAATLTDILLTGVTATYDAPATFLVIEVASGAAGTEQVLTATRVAVNNRSLNWWPLTVPHYIPEGTRLSIRFRQASATVNTRNLAATYVALGPGGGLPPNTPTGCTPGFPAGHVPIFPYQ